MCFGGWVFGSAAVRGADEPAPSTPKSEAAATPTDPLLEKVAKAIAITRRRQLTAGVHTPWQVVHGILALRQDFMLKKPEGGEISGIDWMASGALHDGQNIFEVTPYGGRGHTFTKPYAFEGHPTQFMGYMAMCDLPLDFEFKANEGKTITVKDIINDAKMQVREGPEVTWTLWALAHYLPPDAEWTNAAGEHWSIERLVQIQNRESVLTGACGGTHGLFALAYARNRYIQARKPLRGVWIEADQKVKRFIQEAKTLQNTDGSFSSAYFRGPQHSTDFATRLPANGHLLEWLMVSLPQSELKQEWVRRGVESVATDLIENRKVPVDCGPLYHALHGLILYDYRVNPNPQARPYGRPVMAKREVSAQKPVENKGETEAAPNLRPVPVPEKPAVPRVETPKRSDETAQPFDGDEDARIILPRVAPGRIVPVSFSGVPAANNDQGRQIRESTLVPGVD
jgi:hypothetical protein